MASDGTQLESSQPDASFLGSFFAGYVWLVLKNVIGWLLILASFVIGPLIPGPGGIPMFLIGFALVTLPGKRGFTARVLRGRRFQFMSLRVMLLTVLFAVTGPGIGLMVLNRRWDWLWAAYEQGPWAVARVYGAGALVAWLIAMGTLLASNAMVRFMPRVRRKVRPWLRHRHIRLLPPRRRPRHPHEHGQGPVPVKDEIISFLKKRPHAGQS